jgi:hypothetical protein
VGCLLGLHVLPSTIADLLQLDEADMQLIMQLADTDKDGRISLQVGHIASTLLGPSTNMACTPSSCLAAVLDMFLADVAQRSMQKRTAAVPLYHMAAKYGWTTHCPWALPLVLLSGLCCHWELGT